ncbi:MAG: hypothetical protein ACE1Y1_02525 [Nitrosomonadaceae bacterium]
MNDTGGDKLLLVPTLVPKPASPTVTQGNLPGPTLIRWAKVASQASIARYKIATV